MKVEKLEKHKRNRVHAFSLVEILISLAIVSSSILIILVSVAKATQQATYNKIKMEMITAAGGILNQTQNLLYSRYKDKDYDWDTILVGNIKISEDVNGKNIENAQGCTSNNPLSTNCPSVNEVLNNVNYLGYVIQAEQPGAQNVYKLTITVACLQNTKCNFNRIQPVKMEMYVVKY